MFVVCVLCERASVSVGRVYGVCRMCGGRFCVSTCMLVSILACVKAIVCWFML